MFDVVLTLCQFLLIAPMTVSYDFSHIAILAHAMHGLFFIGGLSLPIADRLAGFAEV